MKLYILDGRRYEFFKTCMQIYAFYYELPSFFISIMLSYKRYVQGTENTYIYPCEYLICYLVYLVMSKCSSIRVYTCCSWFAITIGNTSTLVPDWLEQF